MSWLENALRSCFQRSVALDLTNRRRQESNMTAHTNYKKVCFLQALLYRFFDNLKGCAVGTPFQISFVLSFTSNVTGTVSWMARASSLP